jgi:AcrR family transcriptional regulator
VDTRGPTAITVAPGSTEGEARPTRGRPRAADRTPAIIAATFELIQEVGYDRLRVQDVAARAGVGLATLYRRWPTKRDLVLDTLRTYDPLSLAVPEPTGDARADLEALLRGLVGLVCGKDANTMTGFIAAMRDDPEMAVAFRDEAIGRTRAALRDAIDRAVPAAADLDLRTDAVFGYLLFQNLFTGHHLDPVRTPEELLAFVTR